MKNKIYRTMIIFAIILSTLFSFSVSYAKTLTKENYNTWNEEDKRSVQVPGTLFDSLEPSQQASVLYAKLGSENMLELTVSDFLLDIGDFFMEYITFLFKEEMSIQRIIYNRVDTLNANFFENAITNNQNEAPATKYIRPIVNSWYNFFKNLALIIYMITIVYAGVLILLNGAEGKVRAQDLLTKMVMGLIMLFFFPYVMKYAFSLNESFVNIVKNHYDPGDKNLGSYLGEISDLRKDELEERDPSYVTKGSYILELGSDEATQAYVNRLEEYQTKGDAMRIMRALAGMTGRIIYVLIWYLMLWQLVVFIFVYYKRYLMIAFLIAIFPISMIEYSLGTVITGKQNGLSIWCKEFLVNVFTQTIHAVIYGIITGVIMEQIIAGVNIQNFEVNWVLLLCSINFVFTAEKAIKEIINAMGTESIKTVDEMSKGMQGGMKTVGGKAMGAAKAVGKMAGGGGQK